MSVLWVEGLLGVGLVGLAIRLLWVRDGFETIVLFITFGMLLTLLWSWLGSGDVALAEAAIGAGLSGALLLAAWSQLGDTSSDEGRSSARLPWGALIMAAMGAAVGLFVQLSLADQPDASSTLAQRVEDALPKSGVENPVTAVLLNFRSYDTLLEVTVLVAAWLGVAGPADRPRGASDGPPEADRLAGGAAIALGRTWLPLALLVATYLVWAGSHFAGGAFQAAALLAGTAILCRLVGVPIGLEQTAAVVPGLPIAGLALFAIAGAWGVAFQGRLLAYPTDSAGPWIIAIELAMAISLATILFLLYLAVRRRRGSR